MCLSFFAERQTQVENAHVKQLKPTNIYLAKGETTYLNTNCQLPGQGPNIDGKGAMLQADFIRTYCRMNHILILFSFSMVQPDFGSENCPVLGALFGCPFQIAIEGLGSV